MLVGGRWLLLYLLCFWLCCRSLALCLSVFLVRTYILLTQILAIILLALMLLASVCFVPFRLAVTVCLGIFTLAIDLLVRLPSGFALALAVFGRLLLSRFFLLLLL